MKKVGFKMLVKKFTACALIAAMTISTPFTAYAADFSDNFSISDGTNENDSETGTVSSTHSGTNTTALKDNAGKITGFMIYGTDNIIMTSGNKKVLTAAIITNGSLENATTADLNENIRWRSSVPSVVSVSAKTGSMNKCTINARRAGTATITAFLDVNRDGNYDYTAAVNVEVFDTSQNEVSWNITDTFYVKHTYCLSDYLWINGRQLGESTTDVVTFAVKASPKVATISGDILTIKGEGEITLSAVLPSGEEVISEKITTSAGHPVKKMTASDKKVELDFNNDGVAIAEPRMEVSVEVITVDDEEKTTDDIIWTSNNTSIAEVEIDPTDQTKAVITANAVGKATITAKSTSGKTAKFSVTVKATLISIDNVILNNDSGYAWAGKTDELIIERTPQQNVDKFKVTSDDKRVKVKSTANSVTITPANDLKLIADEEDEDSADSLEVTITVESSDKYSDAEPKEAKITVKQSDVEITKVIDVSNSKDMNKQTVRTNPGETYTYEAVLSQKHQTPGASAVSWVSSNAKVAVVNNGELKIVGRGTAKITASSVYKEKGKYKQIKKAFTVKSTPGCSDIVFKSDTAVYDLSKKKAVTINIKQQLPKGANDEIEWYVNGVKQAASKTVTDKKIVVQPTVFKGMNEGTVEVMAVSKMNDEVCAVATIYVVKKAAKKVAFAEKYKKGVTLTQVGKTAEIPAPTVTEKSCNDPIVSYTVDKKGASVVKAEMTKDGNLKLTGVGEGKATVTALTASGKKGTLKVKVAVK